MTSHESVCHNVCNMLVAKTAAATPASEIPQTHRLNCGCAVCGAGAGPVVLAAADATLSPLMFVAIVDVFVLPGPVVVMEMPGPVVTPQSAP